MKDNVATLDCITKMNATMPMMINATSPMFIIPIRVMASHTQNTPDIVAATVFCRPCILPPAADGGRYDIGRALGMEVGRAHVRTPSRAPLVCRPLAE